MPFTVIGEVSAVAGLIPFAMTRAQDCLNCLDAISTARNFSTNADILRNRFLLARADLMAWMALVVEAREEEDSPLRSLDWRLIADTVGQLESLLKNAEKMERKYHLVIEDTSTLGQSLPESPRSQSYFTRSLAKMRSQMSLTTSRTLQDKTSTWVKTKWGFRGNTKFRALVDDIEKHISAVTRLTHSRQIDYLVKGIGQIVTAILVGATSQQDVDEVRQTLDEANEQLGGSAPYYATTATLSALKARRMELGLDATEVELRESVTPASARTKIQIPRQVWLKGLRMQSIHKDYMQLGADRALAIYDGRRVVLEYKKVPSTLRDKLEHRTKALGILMTSGDSNLLATLPCLGFYDNHSEESYVFVFELPEVSSDNPKAGLQALRNCLANDALSKPSVDSRLGIALTIAQAVRNLHAAGWLHKALRSENVLFAGPPDLVAFADPNAGPFLSGFGYARAANPTEFSEIPPTSTDIDRYCHEAIVGPEARSFRKVFDLFALGIFLLEVMLWKPLDKILQQAWTQADGQPAPDSLGLMPKRKELLAREGPGSIFATLTDISPLPYVEAVKICLSERPEHLWVELENSLHEQNLVVEKLLFCEGNSTC